jgi:hypothetical protein
MEIKKYTQFGTISVIILLPLLILFSGMLIKSGLTKSPEFYIYLFLVLTFLICVLTFYQLTIFVNDTHVAFKLGIGLWSKKYKISDIQSCHPVTNSVISGIGIRMLPNGWLYNVTGLKAIELQFKNKNSVIRIGTNRPEEISELVQSLIGSGAMTAESVKRQSKKWINPLWIISILLIVGLVIIPNFTDTKINVGPNEFKIKGVYGLTIIYSDIERVDTISIMPKISLRTNGYAFGNTLIGNFKLSDESRAKLFIKKGVAPFIMIKSKGLLPVYINFKDKKKTIDLYNNLKNKK